MSKITGKEFQLMKIFSPDFDYHIPSYQRPYAWTDEQTGMLFDDLWDFYQAELDDDYFLGSIVLIKEENEPYADVIDGQQRLTTLTILIAAIAERLTGTTRENCNKYLRDPGNELEGLSALPRLHLRDKDQPFFEKYVQDVKLQELEQLDSEALPDEAQRNIRANCLVLRKKLKEACKSEEDVKQFCKFLVKNCYLVVVCTSNEQSAFRVFSVMNSRGLDLLPIDIIKSQVIGKIPLAERDVYTDKWEDLEMQTSRAGFNDVFTHTRMIFAKIKPKRNLLEEFSEFVMAKTTSKDLIDQILEPYADAYTILKNKKYIAVQHAGEVNEYLFWLNKIDNSDWMPAAMKFMAEHRNEPDYVLWFVGRLERLASYLHVTAQDINHRIDRYKKVLEEMESRPDHNINDKLTSVELSDQEKQAFVTALEGEIYKMTARRRNYVILRLDSFVSCGGSRSNYDSSVFSIEHVLPQNVMSGSQWEKTWPDVGEREYWLNRIANLVPLTRRHNSAAQNFDFDKKKTTYFAGRNGTTSYPLTTQVINQKEWTPSIVEKRQKELIDVFKNKWDL